MTNSHQVIHAHRAVITLGVCELEVFQLPNPEEPYRLSQGQVMKAIGCSANWLSRLQSSTPKIFKALQMSGFTGDILEVSIRGEAHARRANTISIDDSITIWTHFSKTGNTTAIDLLATCARESIQRRADTAFGVIKSEPQYNQEFTDGLKLRQILRTSLAKEQGQELRSAIGWWLRENGLYEDKEVVAEWYSKTHTYLNILITGMSAGDIRKLASLGQSIPVRDHFDTATLVAYASISHLAARWLHQNDGNPIEAIDAVYRAYFGPERPAQVNLEAQRVPVRK
jgi:hypothetical protein